MENPFVKELQGLLFNTNGEKGKESCTAYFVGLNSDCSESIPFRTDSSSCIAIAHCQTTVLNGYCIRGEHPRNFPSLVGDLCVIIPVVQPKYHLLLVPWLPFALQIQVFIIL